MQTIKGLSPRIREKIEQKLVHRFGLALFSGEPDGTGARGGGLSTSACSSSCAVGRRGRGRGGISP